MTKFEAVTNKNEPLVPMTVSQCAKHIKQPRGGYIKRTDFDTTKHFDEPIDSSIENISPSLVGLTVDYLTRFMIINDAKAAFDIPLKGVRSIESVKDGLLGSIITTNLGEDYNAEKVYNDLIDEIYDCLDNKVIISAAKLSGFDIAYRRSPYDFYGVDDINPDIETCSHIRQLVDRTLEILKYYGPVIDTGFDFKGAYTSNIVNGDADYLTKDTLWDLKVIKGYITKDHIFQLLLYWRLGMKSNKETFEKIKYIGIINPRRGESYRYDLSNIDNELVEFIDNDVIGYE